MIGLSFEPILTGGVGHWRSYRKYPREYVDNANWHLKPQTPKIFNRKLRAFVLSKHQQWERVAARLRYLPTPEKFASCNHNWGLSGKLGQAIVMTLALCSQCRV